jgi:hypothetical protein
MSHPELLMAKYGAVLHFLYEGLSGIFEIWLGIGHRKENAVTIMQDWEHLNENYILGTGQDAWTDKRLRGEVESFVEKLEHFNEKKGDADPAQQ